MLYVELTHTTRKEPMKTTKFRVFNAVLIVALVLSMVAFAQPAQALGGGSGAISLTTLGSASTQNFDTLANTGTTNNLTINGWYLNETGSSGNNNGQYAAGTGSGTAGDVYSFGDAASTERAFVDSV